MKTLMVKLLPGRALSLSLRLSFCLFAAATLAACVTTSPRSSNAYYGQLRGALPLEHTTKADVEKLLGNGPNAMGEVTSRERRLASAKARAMRCPEGTLDVYVIDFGETKLVSGQYFDHEELWFRPSGQLCAHLALLVRGQ
jgi:hypothetical protein